MRHEHEQYDVIIVGGGFFGASLAVYLGQAHKKVLLVEREENLLFRASLWNQARVHGGYHYPRSITTGLRSRDNYKIFLDTYRECVVDTFTKYYAIARKFSKVSAMQFKLFCERIDAPLRPARAEAVKEFDKDLIEAVYEVEECAFDATKLRARLHQALSEIGVTVKTATAATKITKTEEGKLLVDTVMMNNSSEHQSYVASEVFLCTYSSMNEVLRNSNLPLIPIRNEFTEMGLVEVPDRFKNAGVTVMCGPFFSVMPFPSKGLHSFSHVRYTPHFTWPENDQDAPLFFDPKKEKTRSKFTFMQHDAARYMPLLNECELRESIWEVKTLLPRNEQDDARPILLKRDHGLTNLTCIIGGKIDNIFDVFAELDMNRHF